MRSSTQIETREIADGDLDGISGGVSFSGGAGAGPVAVFGGVELDGVEEVVGATASALPGAWVAGNVAY